MTSGVVGPGRGRTHPNLGSSDLGGISAPLRLNRTVGRLPGTLGRAIKILRGKGTPRIELGAPRDGNLSGALSGPVSRPQHS
ncbi:hypothetical protein [Mycobacterium scrofulaceum]|uniref:hypothetical protein n=1 Tax=Mycobacterium scrofulaceum TaxID=1783 RepID=UPI00114F92A6|nr:hypothetical protein [Mycobacterium scrofulaceum]